MLVQKRLFKRLLILSFLLPLLLLLPLKAFAFEQSIHVEWAYNGGDHDEIGFKLYKVSPDSIEEAVVTIKGADVRSWDGVITVEEGRSLYSLCAYSAELEGPRSPTYAMEYIHLETGGMPAPTVILKFN